MTASGCRDGDPIVDTRDPAAVLDAIVARCHGARRGSFGRAIVELRETADGPATTVSYALPDRLRIVDPDGRWVLALGADFAGGAANAAGQPLDEERRRTVVRLQCALAAIGYQPLEHPARVERRGPGELAVTDRDGATWTFEFDPATEVPRALRGPEVSIRFVEHHDSGRTRIPLVVDIDGLGRRYLRFLDTGIEFDARAFTPPQPSNDQVQAIVVGGNGRTPRARIESLDEVRWLSIPDPGDWPARMTLFGAAGARLAPLGYGNGGDPMLVTDAEGAWFVVPFVAMRSDAEPVVLAEGERVATVPAHRAAAIDAGPGDWDERIAMGRAALERLLAERGQQAAGPLRVGLNLVGADPAADPAVLRELPMRLILPVQ